MEIQVHKRLTLLLVLAVLYAFIPVSARPKKEKADSLVRLMKAETLEQLVIHGQQYRKALNSTFLHNGTYLISDTALWNVDTKIINAKGHVKVIQDETILTSDKLDYFIDDNLIQFRGSLVQLENKKRNILRTRHLDYNTKDSIAIFANGASMRDADGQIIESMNGTYNSHSKHFIFETKVNMYSDSMFVKTGILFYFTEQERAEFPSFIDFWKDGNMLSADRGWYDKPSETLFFTDHVHGLTPDQEVWTDSLYYYRAPGDLLMLGRVQLQDTTRNVTAVGEKLHYNDTLSRVKLQKNAAVVMRTGEGAKRDTIYMGADTLVYRTIKRCDISDGTVKSCEARLSDILTDPVTEFRRKAAEAAAAAKEENKKFEKPGAPVPRKDDGEEGASPRRKKKKTEEKPSGAETPAVSDSLAASDVPAAPDSLAVVDSLAAAQARKDSLTAPLTQALERIDSLAGTVAPADSLANAGDMDVTPPRDMDIDAPSIPDTAAALLGPADLTDTSAVKDTTARADSVPPPPDTTKIGFITGIKNVRIFRKDIQMRCDSMCYTDLDSIARFYVDPVVWNDGNRQYTADSLFFLVDENGPKKASLQSNAFVIIQQNEVSYDQIKGTEIMAYFNPEDNSLRRFDALGGASGIFYLRENETFATVNKVESKMMSGILADGDIDQVYYFESPKNNAFPVPQIPEADKIMKGFNWRPDERPASPEAITTITPRPSERTYYESKPGPAFVQTELYFPGYIKGIKRAIAIRDSLARIKKPAEPVTLPEDSLASLPALADSVALDTTEFKASVELADSLLQADKPAMHDGGAQETSDSLQLAGGAPLDSLGTGSAKPEDTVEETDPLSVPTLDPKQKRKEERELKRKLRQAARDAREAAREARWAELDRQDSLKLVAKQQKALEKQRAKTLKLILKLQKQDEEDQAKLEKYIAKYRKQYEREQKRKASRKRTPAVEAGGEVPAPPESGAQTPRGDAVLRDDGIVDDSPVLGGGSLSRAEGGPGI